MQLLATRGLEHGETRGLGWIDGTVRLMEPTDRQVKVPHMGWNDVGLMPHARGHEVVSAGEAYFLHSYHFKARYHEDVLAMTDHGGGLVAAAGLRDRLFLASKVWTQGRGAGARGDLLGHAVDRSGAFR